MTFACGKARLRQPCDHRDRCTSRNRKRRPLQKLGNIPNPFLRRLDEAPPNKSVAQHILKASDSSAPRPRCPQGCPGPPVLPMIQGECAKCEDCYPLNIPLNATLSTATWQHGPQKKAGGEGSATPRSNVEAALSKHLTRALPEHHGAPRTRKCALGAV